ncbi:MAG: DUF3575 domain-containing protein [Bacteroides sp.]|nr:DUF3575 domain-containing protein [Bacteroides sp.]
MYRSIKPVSTIVIAFLTSFLFVGKASSQSFALKSNVLYDLTGTVNLGGEVRCGERHSLSLGVSYNPWEYGSNKKTKLLLVQPEFRYWLGKAFAGSFFGVQAHYAQYNFAGTTPFRTIKDNRYQGNLIGCGLTYGYQWIIGDFWSLEASLSVGYAYLSYDRYGPAKGDAMTGSSHRNYVGPTQIGLSFVYFIR